MTIKLARTEDCVLGTQCIHSLSDRHSYNTIVGSNLDSINQPSHRAWFITVSLKVS